MMIGRRSLLGALPALTLVPPLIGACSTIPTASAAAEAPAPLSIEALELVADNLATPEGVVIAPDGRIVVSDKRGCILIPPGGEPLHVASAPAAAGLAMDAQGRLVIANVGLLHDTVGPLQRFDLSSGRMEVLAAQIDGRTLVASNWPAVGPDGVYCTHSTWRDLANIGTTDPGGFVYKVSEDGTISMVATGIRGANGCCFDADFSHLYVAQTASGEILKFKRQPDGTYGDRVVFGPRLGQAPDNVRAEDIFGRMSAEQRGALGHPDGIALDTAGNLFVAVPFANRIVAITPQGATVDVLSDPEGRRIDMPTSIAWGGKDLRELHIVSRRNGKLWKVRANVAGLPLPHWRHLGRPVVGGSQASGKGV